MEQNRKIWTKNQVKDELNTRNTPLVDLIYDLPLYSDLLVWQESNVERTRKWTGPFKLLGIKSETCLIYLPSGFTKFRSIIVKPYLVDDNNTQNYFSPIAKILPLAQDLLPDTSLLPVTKTSSTPITRLFWVWQPPIKYQNMANVSTFL